MKIIKRDGRKVQFNPTKISDAVKGAAKEAKCVLPDSQFLLITQQVLKMIEDKLEVEGTNEITVEEVQDIVEKVLGKAPFKSNKGLKEAYAGYRKERTQVREFKSELMKTISKIGEETDKNTSNLGDNYSAKLLTIASETNRWYNLANMPKDLAKAHENLDMYYHNLDGYNLTLNSLYIPTGEILKKGFKNGYGVVRTPKRIETAAEISCLLLQATQNDMSGGQSHFDFDNDLGAFVEPTRKEIKEELLRYGLEGIALDHAVEKKVRDCVRQAMQGVIYNLNMIHSRVGSQVTISTINIGIPRNKDAALVCELLLSEYEKGLGKGEQPIYPNIVFRVKKGVNALQTDPYNYLFKLACRVSAKRMNIAFMNLDADFNKEHVELGYLPAITGARDYVMSNANGEGGVAGRGNIAYVTLNLPRLGLLANGDESRFFELLSERLDIARESLMHRYGILKKLKVKDLPFVAGEQIMRGSKGLKLDDSIEPILKQCTLSIGFIGLSETLVALTGHHHGETKEARALGEKIVKYIRKYTDTLTKRTKLNWTCYATAEEDVCSRFIVQDQKVFGRIAGITDKMNYTNSFHIQNDFEMDNMNKLEIESVYHKICNGGHISYVNFNEYPVGEDIENIITNAFSNSNIGNIGLNFHIKYCRGCGSYIRENENICGSCRSTEIQGVSRQGGYLAME